MESDIDVETLVAKWDQMKLVEQEKNDILENALSALRHTLQRSKENEDKCDRMDMENSSLHSRLRESFAERSTLQQLIDRKSFVLVLIDGDITLFLDEYIVRGSAGGRDAAIALYTLCSEEVQRIHQLNADAEVVVKVYANIRGLARKYQRSGIVLDETRVLDFIAGFNKERTLFEFIDAGDDKEAADRKIKGNFELYWSLPQYKRIVLAGSGDRGYVGFLREYTQYQAQCARLALLKGLPFHRDFESIASRLDVIEAPHIFRGSPLPEVSAPQAQAPSPSTHHVPTSYSNAVVNGAQPSSSFGQRGRSPVLHGDTSILDDQILYNAAGHRIDPHVRYDRQLRDRFMSMPKRYCFDHHLRHCPRPEGTCSFVHGDHLASLGYDTLLSTARLNPCKWRNCNRPSCYMGHHCGEGVRCNRTCKFSEDWHEVDMNVIRTVRV